MFAGRSMGDGDLAGREQQGRHPACSLSSVRGEQQRKRGGGEQQRRCGSLAPLRGAGSSPSAPVGKKQGRCGGYVSLGGCSVGGGSGRVWRLKTKTVRSAAVLFNQITRVRNEAFRIFLFPFFFDGFYLLLVVGYWELAHLRRVRPFGNFHGRSQGAAGERLHLGSAASGLRRRRAFSPPLLWRRPRRGERRPSGRRPPSALSGRAGVSRA